MTTSKVQGQTFNKNRSLFARCLLLLWSTVGSAHWGTMKARCKTKQTNKEDNHLGTAYTCDVVRPLALL